ncbi:MAG: histidine phosphatase family protein [Muribaculaceae bacterium]|nr:histidine phosphatase family protein [Muribaculaceae bacterium]
MSSIIFRLTLAAVLSCPFVACAQTTFVEIAASPDKAAGLYYKYPVSKSQNTKAPKGFKPFYISHYGRHGSRYLVEPEQYGKPYEILERADKAGALTDFGKDVMNRLAIIKEDAAGREGELTPIGVKQHHDIAQRMYKSFPEVFAGEPILSARSTTVMRCAHSMAAFCEGLKELKPSLNIPRESGKRYMKYMANVSPQGAAFTKRDSPSSKRSNEFAKDVTEPDRLMSAIFKDDEYLKNNNIDGKELMRSLFLIATDVPNTECDVRLDDLFTPEERFKLWKNFNYHYYIHMSNPTSAQGAILDNARPLLANIVESADEAIASGKNGADFRFGHDSCIVPLLGLMKVDGCYGSTDDPYELHTVYADYKISPMAANLQMIFFIDKKGEVIVKFMLNEREVGIPVETDIYPFYKWDETRDYFNKILGEK